MAICLTAALVSCDRQDDIDEIFIGRTWYMNGGTINGMRMNAEIKNFFVEGQPSAYSITFAADKFTGMFRNTAPFSGKWAVDGKNHTITLTFDEKPNISSDFDHRVFNVLNKVTSYSSGATFLTLEQDRYNSIMFGNKR